MKLSKFHDKNYKKLLLIPLVLLLASIAYLGFFYSQTGDFIQRDITLTGGTSITVYGEIDKVDLDIFLSERFENFNTREIYDLTTQSPKAIIIETTQEGDLVKSNLEEYLGYDLVEGENSDFEFTGSSLSQGFYRQLLVAILVAFAFMAFVVFLIFRTFIPSVAVITSAFADIIMTLAFVNLIGVQMSTAGIIAFLLVIGYSVDTDILLTTRILKRKNESLNRRIFSSFTTGVTMTLTSLFAFLFTFLIVQSFSNTLAQILGIVAIALFFDLINTWITNVSILKWYMEKRK